MVELVSQKHPRTNKIPSALAKHKHSQAFVSLTGKIASSVLGPLCHQAPIQIFNMIIKHPEKSFSLIVFLFERFNAPHQTRRRALSLSHVIELAKGSCRIVALHLIVTDAGAV
jgi:hypothetical protein